MFGRLVRRLGGWRRTIEGYLCEGAGVGLRDIIYRSNVNDFGRFVLESVILNIISISRDSRKRQIECGDYQ